MSSVTGVSTVDTFGGGAEPTQAGTGRLADKAFKGAATGAGVIVIAIVTLLAVFLLSQALPSLLDNKVNFLTSREWNVDNTANLRFGIAQLLYTTIAISLMAMVLAVPLAIGVALFITQYAPKKVATPAAYLIDLLAAVPSIIYGLWGLSVFSGKVAPIGTWLQSTFGFIPFLGSSDTGVAGSIFVAGIVVGIMILPIVTAISRDVFAQTPAFHKEAALALGATRWEMIRTTVLPYGRPGVISGSMLGLGRALGETIAITIIVSGLNSNSAFSLSLFNGGETFASKIANNSGEFSNPAKTGAFIAAGLVLFVLTFVVNAAARAIVERRKAFTE
ncbi:MAG TPA: phosphate ABC transporter permease subunit PstC [Actinomycetales bacterium]|jgi:phosphate transport system permease protein